MKKENVLGDSNTVYMVTCFPFVMCIVEKFFVAVYVKKTILTIGGSLVLFFFGGEQFFLKFVLLYQSI